MLKKQSAAQTTAARKLRAIMATYAEAEDLIRIGAYARGSSRKWIGHRINAGVNMFLRQELTSRTELETTRAALDILRLLAFLMK